MEDQRWDCHLGQEGPYVHTRVELNALRRDLRRHRAAEGIGVPALYFSRLAWEADSRDSPPGQAPVAADQLHQTPSGSRFDELHAARIRCPQHQARQALRMLSGVGHGDGCAVKQPPQVEPLQFKTVDNGGDIGDLGLE